MVEYAILLSWLALASAAFLMGWGRGVFGIWTAANTQLAAANASASSWDKLVPELAQFAQQALLLLATHDPQ